MIQLVFVDKEQAPPPVAAIVLAAGGSSRMGEPKQLLQVGDQPMVRHAAEAACAAGLAQVVVVVGAHAGPVAAALADLPAEIVVNDDWARGMSTSLRAGLAALVPRVGAVLVVLADQPSLTGGLLRSLVARYRATGAPIVVPVYGGKRGNPVLFDRRLFPELLAVEGDRGGRDLLERHHDEVEWFEAGDPAVLRDVDTPEDYREVIEKR
jgi:molybdenum cofactor cytidylyltransferase